MRLLAREVRVRGNALRPAHHRRIRIRYINDFDDDSIAQREVSLRPVSKLAVRKAADREIQLLTRGADVVVPGSAGAGQVGSNPPDDRVENATFTDSGGAYPFSVDVYSEADHACMLPP